MLCGISEALKWIWMDRLRRSDSPKPGDRTIGAYVDELLTC